MSFDLSLQLVRHGYDALPRMWGDGDPSGRRPSVMHATLLGRHALVVRGPEAARLFYDQDLLERDRVVPAPLAHLLFGPGAVHGLDDGDHLRRKALFLQAWGPAGVQQLGDLVELRLREAAEGWPRRGPFGLHGELARLYGASVMSWVGLQEDPHEAERLSALMADVVDGFGFSPRAYARGWAARLRLDSWSRRVVKEARRGTRPVPDHGILHQLVEGAGASLPAQVAGVELLNVLRPTVAVAWLGTFAALALLQDPQHGGPMMPEDGAARRRAFAQEVRRLTPFVPALAARLREDVTFHGEGARAGDLVVLDVPGTNRDPLTWESPVEFRPERFLDREPTAYDLVPQGGGPLQGHRCPGEDIALTLLERTLLVLSRTEFTARTAQPRLDRMPTLPEHGLLITRARLTDGCFLALVQT